MPEKYTCHGCSAVFAAGYGPDNIHEVDGNAPIDARRHGDCPVCGTAWPGMTYVGGEA
jgi:hypothetical protein